ncbi:putative drug resistance efflux protein [Rhodococcus sp. AW25M09]|uniref:MFS transporter n=1 Tax=Rhodococcus sp. AW25M09 TaxID=1268303 RepID=UPI0002ACCD28|nr:MFS transporter [Rhodococcus sp. AW25M09]CCQ14813.1 putative drug resistance efflux protein [Rhodococcus sp. AW25M09]
MNGRSLGVLAVACMAQLLVVLDISVVNVALPHIASALDIADRDVQWVASGYTVAFAAALLTGARAADSWGIRRVFLFGTSLFIAASVAGGVAPTGSMLVAARVGQGLAAAIVSPATFTLLTVTYPEGPIRTRAVAVWTAISVAGGGVGNIVGGALTEYLTWRSVLLINLPIGLVVLTAALRYLPTHRREAQSPRTSLDPIGAVSGAALLGASTVAVTAFGAAGSRPLSLSMTLVASAGLIGFLIRQHRSTAPLIPLRLFADRTVVAGNLLTLLTGAVFQIPIWLFLTYQMQQLLQRSPLQAAVGFLPLTTALVVIGVAVTPRLMRRYPPHLVAAAGAAVAAVGLLALAVASDSSSYLVAVALPSILIGTGGGLLNTPLATAVTSGVARRDAGAASGLMNTCKQFGGAIGLAVLTATAGLTNFRLAYCAMATAMALTAGCCVAFLRERRTGY